MFERELKKFIPRPGMEEIFKMVICDTYDDDSRFFQSERKRLIDLISNQNNRLTRSRELLLSEIINGKEYQKIKIECEEKIIRTESELNELSAKVSHGLDIDLMVTGASSNLKNVFKLYSEADIEGKRYMIGSILAYGRCYHRTIKNNKARCFHIEALYPAPDYCQIRFICPSGQPRH